MRRLSIKIDNRTKYSTRSLRVLFAAVHRRFMKLHDRPRLLDVAVRSKRSGSAIDGYAWLNSNKVVLHLPKPPLDVDMRREVALTLYHELLHCVGIKSHREPAFDLKRGDFAYVDSCQLEVELPRVKMPKSVDTKVTALKARRKRWVSKLKRAQTALKKIDRSLKYYAKKGAS